MIKKEIEIVVETGAANKEAKQLKDTIEETGGVAKKSGAEATKSIEGVGKASKDTEKSAKSASVGVKAIGLALKALGIGLVLAAVGFLADAFSRNQRFADLLSVALTTISNVTSDLVTAIFNTVEQVMKATNGFESLGKVVKGLITIAFTPLKLSLLAIKLAFQETQLAWEKSFFGDNDPKTITELNDRIDKTRLNILEVGKDALKAGKDVATNIVGAIVEVANVAIIANNNLSKVSITSALEQAKVTTQLKNTAELAAASIQGLIEKYDREAELLRQIRDDDRLSIEQRIKANEELGLKLDEQADAQKNLANASLQLARQNLKGNEDNVALRKAEIEALNEIAAIEASVTGFRAEQLTNRNALDKERIELLRELNEIGKTDVELAKSEAEQLRDDRLIQIELQVEDETEKFRLLAAAKADFDATIAELDLTESERIKADAAKVVKDAEETAAKLKAIEDAKDQQKIDAINNLQSIANSAEQIAGKQTAATKAFAVATTLASTYLSAQKAYESQFLPIADATSPLRGAIAAGAAVASGLANVKNILSVKVAGQSGGGGANAAAGGGRQSSPAFNLTGRSNVNQLQTGIDQQETAPVRAFVVSQDVTNQQAADRATRSQASFG
jgi:hypothetical protein